MIYIIIIIEIKKITIISYHLNVEKYRRTTRIKSIYLTALINAKLKNGDKKGKEKLNKMHV